MRIDLANYIEQAKKSGMSNKRIYEGLLLTGWGQGNSSPFSGPSAEPSSKLQWQMTPVQKKIAIFFLVVLISLFGAFIYAKNLAREKYDKVSAAALEAQNKTEELKQKRFQNPTVILDPIAGWQTYRNDEYGFEFKYPKDWEFNISESYGKKAFSVAEENNLGSVSIIEGEFDHGAPINDSIEDIINFRGLAFKRETWRFTKEEVYKLISLDNTNLDRIELSANTRVIELIADQILSTFRFVEQDVEY